MNGRDTEDHFISSEVSYCAMMEILFDAIFNVGCETV